MSQEGKNLDVAKEIVECAKSIKETAFAIPSGVGETKIARELRDKIEKDTNKLGRLEPYKIYKFRGQVAMPYLSIWYFVSMIIFFGSFGVDPTKKYVNTIVSIASLAVLIIGLALHISLLFGVGKLSKAKSKKVSYNVIAGDIGNNNEQSIILTANHDDKYGTMLKDREFSKKLTGIALPIATLIYMLLLIARAGIGATDKNIIAVFVVFPLIFCGFSIYLIITHFSLLPKHVVENNGISIGIALKLFEYFSKEENKLNNYNVKFVSFGGETLANAGSYAFFKYQNKTKKNIVINISHIISGEFKVNLPEAIKKTGGEYFKEFLDYIKEDSNISKSNEKRVTKLLDTDKRYASDVARKFNCEAITIYTNKSKIYNYQVTEHDIAYIYEMLKEIIEKIDKKDKQTASEEVQQENL